MLPRPAPSYARGNCPWAGPCGVAAPLVRAGRARSGLITGRVGPGQTAFRALDFGYAGILLLLLADNYNLKTNDFTTKARRHKGRTETFWQRDPRQSPALQFLQAIGSPRPRAGLAEAALLSAKRACLATNQLLKLHSCEWFQRANL